jgi:rhodanese-related sulfurtransferase
MAAAGPRLRLIGPAPMAGALRAGATVVHGRSPVAYDAGYLPGAVNVPVGPCAGELSALVLGFLLGSVHLPPASLLPDVPTVTCCSDGRRAAVAASALRRWSHRNVWRSADVGLDLLGAA